MSWKHRHIIVNIRPWLKNEVLYFITWDSEKGRIIEKPCGVNLIKNIIASYAMPMNE